MEQTVTFKSAYDELSKLVVFEVDNNKTQIDVSRYGLSVIEAKCCMRAAEKLFKIDALGGVESSQALSSASQEFQSEVFEVCVDKITEERKGWTHTKNVVKELVAQLKKGSITPEEFQIAVNNAL